MEILHQVSHLLESVKFMSFGGHLAIKAPDEDVQEAALHRDLERNVRSSLLRAVFYVRKTNYLTQRATNCHL
jgi:hypothetical protein